MSIKKSLGFTLLEILVALFIFTIIAMIMVGALHTVLTTQSVTEKNAARFNQLQMAITIISRDLEQIIDRPIINPAGTKENALIGTNNDLRFTHSGNANPNGELVRSTLQRTHYFSRNRTIIRESWPELDITRDSTSAQRELLTDIDELSFEYLDQNGKFQHTWPPQGQSQANLPYAVRITLSLKTLGKVSQLYVIPH